jgi:opacity protein-like surface antigen
MQKILNRERRVSERQVTRRTDLPTSQESSLVTNVAEKYVALVEHPGLRGIRRSCGCALLLLPWLHVAPAQAAVLIPEKSGVSGFVNLGAGYASVKSSFMAKTLFGSVDLGNEKIDSLESSPDKQDGILPVASFELSYTLAESRTQFYLGNLLEDFLRFDTNTVFGVRQSIGRAGILGASLRNTAITTEVWEDPFVTGVKRNETDRESVGYRVFWQQIFGTGLEIEYTGSDVDIDDERSGQALGLSPAEQKLLDRNGDISRLEFRYEFNLDNRRHIFTPGITFIDNDRDGSAVSYDAVGVNFNYIYSHNRHWRHVINFAYSDFDLDKTNPVYGIKDSAKQIGGSYTAFYLEPFGWNQWSANLTLGWFEDDRDIDFYDTSVRLVTLGLLRRF